MSWHCYFARRYDEALQHLSKALDTDPQFVPTRLFLGQVYEQQSRLPDAIREFETAVSLSGGLSRCLAGLGHAYARAGQTDQARKVLEQLMQNRGRKYVAPNDVATVYVGLCEKDLAFEWLKKAREERGNWLLFVNVDPRFDPLRDDPRFDRLVQQIGLPPARPRD